MTTTYILKKFESGMHYVMLNEEIVKTLTAGNNKRVIVKLNNQLEIHSAIMPKKEGGHYINIGLTHCKKLNIKAGSTILATFSFDQTTYQFEMPEELLAVLETDQKAYTIFHSLTEGNQRGLIYLVGQVKSSNKKIERALKIADNLKKGITSPRIILK